MSKIRIGIVVLCLLSEREYAEIQRESASSPYTIQVSRTWPISSPTVQKLENGERAKKTGPNGDRKKNGVEDG